MPVTSRSRLALDQDRDGLLVWSYDGALAGAGTLAGKSLSRTPILLGQSWYDANYYGWWQLPDGTKPGRYKLDCGQPLDVEVVAPPARKMARIAANDDSLKNIRKALATGALLIILEPGEHVWGEMLTLPDWAVIRGYGATVRHGYKTNVGTNWPLIWPGNEVSVYGVTFVHDRKPGQVFLYLGDASKFPTGLVVADCTFRRCNFGFFVDSAFVRDCTFDDAGAVIAPGGLWLRCKFLGSYTDPLQFWTPMRPAAVVDCTFDGTSRGIIWNAPADAADFLTVGISYRNVDKVGGGNELHAAEGYGVVRRLVALHTRVSGCNGSFLQLEHSGQDILVWDYEQRGGFGVWLRGDVGISNVVFKEFQLSEGAGILLSDKATNCTFTDGCVFNWTRNRYASNFNNFSPAALSRTVACLAEGPNAGTNTLKGVMIEGTGKGFVDAQGFRVDK